MPFDLVGVYLDADSIADAELLLTLAQVTGAERAAEGAREKLERDDAKAAKNQAAEADNVAKKQAFKEQAMIEEEYKKLWWSSTPPIRGKLPTMWADVPSLLKENEYIQLRHDELRTPDKDSGFQYVDAQTGKKKKDGVEVDRGWVGQLSLGRPLWRLCLVHEPELAALMCVAAHLDKRIRSKKAAGSWLLHLVAHPDAVAKWLADPNVDLTKSLKVPRRHNLGRPRKDDGLHNRRVHAKNMGTFKARIPESVTAPLPVL